MSAALLLRRGSHTFMKPFYLDEALLSVRCLSVPGSFAVPMKLFSSRRASLFRRSFSISKEFPLSVTTCWPAIRAHNLESPSGRDCTLRRKAFPISLTHQVTFHEENPFKSVADGRPGTPFQASGKPRQFANKSHRVMESVVLLVLDQTSYKALRTGLPSRYCDWA